MRYRAVTSSFIHFVVFTGTSGKTLARSATAYAYKKAGLHVVSPPYGYTNELGIVLAALGIESVHLFSLQGIRKVLSASLQQETYVCIELGADFRSDIPWFLKRFTPQGVCITNVSDKVWTKDLSSLWKDKKDLIACIPTGGFLCYSAHNTSIDRIRHIEASTQDIQVALFQTNIVSDSSFNYSSSNTKYIFTSPLAILMPYTEAFGFAIASLEILNKNFVFPEIFFSEYIPVQERISKRVTTHGATLVTDTYKAIPESMEYVLGFALTISSKKKIAVVSAMHPLWAHTHEHYGTLISFLNRFDKVYCIGPQKVSSLLAKKVHGLQIIHDTSHYQEIAMQIQKELQPETVLVIHGASRYHLEKLVTLVTK